MKQKKIKSVPAVVAQIPVEDLTPVPLGGISTSDMDDILRRMKEEREENEESASSGKNKIIEELKKIAASKAIVGYSGSGDSGQIDDTTVYDSDGDSINIDLMRVQWQRKKSVHQNSKWVTVIEDVEMSLQELIEDCAYDWLESVHGGWENNDGASGTITFYAETGVAEMEHGEYVSEQNWQTDVM